MRTRILHSAALLAAAVGFVMAALSRSAQSGVATDLEETVRQSGLADAIYEEALPALWRETAAALPLGSDATLVARSGDAELVAQAVEIVWPRAKLAEEVTSLTRSLLDQLDDDHPVELRRQSTAWADHLPAAARFAIREMELGPRLHHELVENPFAAKLRPQLRELLGVDLSAERTSGLSREIVPPAWTSEQLELFAVASVPYWHGQKDRFEVRIDLVPIVERSATTLRAEVDRSTGATARDLLLDRLVDPLLEQATADIEWPNGARLTRDELRVLLGQSTPATWAAAKARSAISQLERFLVDPRAPLTFRVPLTERKVAFASALAEAVEEKLINNLNGLSRCSWLETAGATAALMDGAWPACRPAGLSLWRSRVAAEIQARTTEAVDALPDELVIDEKQLASPESLGPETVRKLHELRDVVQSGAVIRSDNWLTKPTPGWAAWLRGERVPVPALDEALQWPRWLVRWEPLLWLASLTLLVAASLTRTPSKPLRVVHQVGVRGAMVAGVTAAALAISAQVTWIGPTALESPMGSTLSPSLAAPLSQLAQSLLSAWLSGAAWTLVVVAVASGAGALLATRFVQRSY